MPSDAPTLIDLECAGLEGVEQYYDDSEPIEAPSNYVKDEAKANYIARETVRRREQFIKQAALDPDLCRIVCLGVWPPRYEHPCILECHDESMEVFALDTFWGMFHHGEVLCGYNIRSYDIPVLLRRSLYLGVETKPIDRDRYRSQQIIDLFELLNEGRKHQMHSLDWYCRRMQIPCGIEDTITGADVPGCVARGEWDRIRAHLLADLCKIRGLAQRVGVMSSLVEA